MKYFLFLWLTSLLWAGISPFSHVRVASYGNDGEPNEEIIDLTVCIEREPSKENSQEKYERIFRYWADAIYEMSNGGNYLGKIRIFPGGRFVTGCDVIWKKCGVWANANVGAFNHGGALNYSDFFDGNLGTCKDSVGENRRANAAEAAGTLAHESMHYIYGLYDEYGSAEIDPRKNEIALSVDPDRDLVILTKQPGVSLERFRTMIEPYKQRGALVKFIAYFENSQRGIIPSGLREENSKDSDSNGRPYKIEKDQYDAVDKVYSSEESSGIFAFSLKNVDIRDKGVYPWGLSLPTNTASTPNTISWHSGAFDAKNCGVEPQWQWWNFSTSYNIRRYSPQGMNFRKDDREISGWDVLSSDPDLDQGLGVSASWPRRWFKSLKNRAPTEADIYHTTTFLNYDEKTSWWKETDATWWETTDCSKLQEIDIPYMKSELAGKAEEEYSKLTRKYLEMEWIEKTKMEVIVVIDHSSSMIPYKKMEQAKLAAKFVAGGFLSDDPAYDASNVSVGVYAFNSDVSEIFPLRSNPELKDLYAAIDKISAKDNTALFDALKVAIASFSEDASSLKLLYVISDGKDNKSKATKEEIVKLYQSQNVAIHAFAYGQNADKDLLSSMAAETGGSYYEQEDRLFLKISNAVTAVLANVYGNEQIAEGSLEAGKKSDAIYILPNSRHLRLLGSYRGEVLERPLEIIFEGGANVASKIQNFSIDDRNFFILEVDSASLQANPSSFIRLRSRIQEDSLEYRIILSESRQERSMDVQLEPVGKFKWPSQGKFYASIQSGEGLLTGVSATGYLVNPDGFKQAFLLHDDGKDGDLLAGDGIYTAQMPLPKSNGTYQWQVELSNENRQAITTRVGSSLPDSIEFIPVPDKGPFRLIRNGQFVVEGCCFDEADDEYPELHPDRRIVAVLQNGKDVDRFRIVETELDKSYSLLLSSSNLNAFDKLEIFSPNSMDVPIYSVPIPSENSKERISFALGAELAKSGYVIAVNGKDSADVSYSLLLVESDQSSFSVGRFEFASDWSSAQGGILQDFQKKSEGRASLVSVGGWKIIESRNVSSEDFELIGETLAMDVYVPQRYLNPYWIGDMELWLDVPSANKRIQLGNSVSLAPYFGEFTTYYFPIDKEFLKLLGEPHSDLRFQIVLNTADSLWIDHLRFEGKLRENSLGRFEPKCSGDVGCDEENPIQLGWNESVQVVSEGDLWVEVVGIPTEWAPNEIVLGIAPEDGRVLTGRLEKGKVVSLLNGWYWQESLQYAAGDRFLFKIHNLGGRSYRLRVWGIRSVVLSMKKDR